MKTQLLPVLIFISQLLSAQTFTEMQGTPFEGVEQSSVAFADIDGDGDEDVLITGKISSNLRIAKLYTNDGMGNYAEMTGTPFDGVYYSSVAFADVDGDNDEDVLITGRNGSNDRITKLYANDGMGNYAEMTGTPFEGVYKSSVAFVDVDGDNDQDVLITGDSSIEGIAKLYKNDGGGNFTEVQNPFEGVFESSVAFADVDGDNDQDILITGRNNAAVRISKLYSNDGAGNFTEATGTPFQGVSCGSAAFADVDGDNDQDLIITGQISNSTDPISRQYHNDGMGNFSELASPPFEDLYDSSIAFADVDGDTDEDILITGGGNSGYYISKLYSNDGMGNYAEILGTPFGGVHDGSAAFADVDGDNDLDILITGEKNSSIQITKLYINETVSSIGGVDLQLDFVLYPNPSKSDKITVSYTSKEIGLQTISIFDPSGQLLIRRQEQPGIGKQTFSIDISSLAKGNYSLQIEDGKRRGVRSFVVGVR